MTCNCIGGFPCPCRLPILKRTDYGYSYYDTQVQTMPEFKLHTQYYGNDATKELTDSVNQHILDTILHEVKLITLQEFDDEI